MKVAITGTPGTGKTSVCKKLAESLKYKLIDLNEIAEKNDLFKNYDKKRDSYVVETDYLNEALAKELKNTKRVIIDGHLSHYYKDLDLVVILRTNPNDLRRRLESKGWNKGKVIENVQAEILDVILQEAVQLHSDICEIDTSKRPIDTVVQEIINLIKKPEKRNTFRPGKIDWSGYSAYF